MIIIDGYNEFQVNEDNSLLALVGSINKEDYNESYNLFNNYIKDV